MDGSERIEITVLGSLGDIDAADWDACAGDGAAGRPVDPFTTHRFLAALEASGSVGPGTGWSPRHLVARAGGVPIAVMPLYAKGHSQGEYIFDHNWAHAWERAGGRYYPKLQAAVPFTPATGRRFLTRPGHEADGRAALLQGALALAAPVRRCRACTSPSAPRTSATGARASASSPAPPSSSTGTTAATPTSTPSSPTSPRASARRSARSASAPRPSAATSWR